MLAKSIPIHSLILSYQLFCLPLLLFPFTVPCRIIFAKPEDLETWPNHNPFLDYGQEFHHKLKWLPGSFLVLLFVCSFVPFRKCSVAFGSISFQRSALSLTLLLGSTIHIHTEIQGVSKKCGPFLKMLYLLHLWTKLFKIFSVCRKLILLCSNDVLLSGGAAYRK